VKDILTVIVVVAVGLFLFARDRSEKAEKQQAAYYAEERAWKDPIIHNCENAVRSMADTSSLQFGDRFGRGPETIDKTDSGYLYYVTASDATTGNTPITILCYTNRQGQVVRVVPKAQM
jgi:hypothetical protein